MSRQETSLPRVHVAVRAIDFGEGKGGLERAASDHINALTSLGWKICLHAPIEVAPDGIESRRIPWPKIAPVPGSPLYSSAYYIWTRQLAKSLADCHSHGDIVHFHGATAGALRWLPNGVRRYAVLNPHGMEEFGRASLLRMASRIPTRVQTRLGARYARVTIATDERLVPVVERYLRPQGEIVTIPNGVDLRRLRKFASSGEAPPHVRHSVVSVGRLVHNKGYDLLAEALSALARDSAKSFSWVHYGNGPEAESIVKIAKREPLVRLDLRTSRADTEVQAAIANCRVFVQPSRYEGSSLTVIEALAHGARVVATPVGGIPDKVIDNETGFLTQGLRPRDIAFAIDRALSDGTEGVSQSARELVRAKFDLDLIARTYEATYRALDL